MNALRVLPLAATGVALVAAIACAGGVASRPVPSPGPPVPTPVPRPVMFPEDEGAHGERLEWWYYSGHLAAHDGATYGFHFAVFQSLEPDAPGEPPPDASYAAHFSVTAPEAERHIQGARFGIAPALPAGKPLDLSVAGWRLTPGPGEHQFTASLEDASLSLSLRPVKPAALHNEIGWLAGPTTGWTYYYSWPRMAAEGALTLGEQTMVVAGDAWMDHQWGEFFVVGHPAGWQWFGLQLDDGTEIMVTETRDTDGAVDALYGSLIDTAGDVIALASGSDAIRLRAEGSWTSPTTRAAYPSGWSLSIPGRGVELVIEPVLPDQEVTSARPESAIYWEGEVRVSGSRDGLPVGGLGYVELTGYVVPPPLPWREPASP